MKKIILLLLVAVISLNGCSVFKRKVEIHTTYVEKPELTISDPSPLDLQENIGWVVITKDNQADVFKKLQEDGKEPVLMGVPSDQYQALSLNLQKVINYIQLQKDIISAFRTYYKTDTKTQQPKKVESK